MYVWYRALIMLGYFGNQICLALVQAWYPEWGSLTDKDTEF